MRIDKELCTLCNIQDIDLEGKTVYNPEKMTVKQLKVVLKDLKLCVVAKRTLKRKTSNKSFRTMDRWLLISRELGRRVNSSFLFRLFRMKMQM